MSRNWMLLTAMGFVFAGFAILLMWWAYGRLIMSGYMFRQTVKRRLPLWRSLGAKDYELLERREV